MLFQRIASGDATAVALCLERYGNLVWSAARKWSRDSSEAEDAVQEIFVDLWQSAGRFNPEIASEPTFVMMIARRRLIDRRRRAASRLENIDGSDHDRSDFSCDPAALAERGEEAILAAKCLQDLRPEERNVLVLSIHDGLTHEEISQRVGMPLGSVKSNIRRGLSRLREKLSKVLPASASRGEL
jgi:RNA polymerase sigma-70 factor (ECF subfamily)